jgi:FkbM family methyltransferase
LVQVEYIRREIFELETYRQSGFELRPHDTVIDVGGNMGMFTLWAAPQVAEGRVIAIEPTDAINHLRTNVDRNRLDNVVTVRAGLGRDNKERSFIYYPENSAISHHDGFRQPLATRILAKVPLFRRTQHAPIHVMAPTMSLGKIMDEYGVARVSFLKIDCEGGEYEIVRHVTPAEWRRIDRIAMEFHEFSPEHRYQILEMQLRDQGFQVEVCRPFFHYHLLRTGMIWASRSPMAPSS